MNDVQLLTELLEADHRNTLLQGMLADELMEVRSIDREAADEVVWKIVEDTAAGPVWYKATEVMRHLTKQQRTRLWVIMADMCGVAVWRFDNVVIVPGQASPVAEFHDDPGGWTAGTQSITISAEWFSAQDL